MPITLTTDNQLRDAYHKKIYQVIEWLKNMLDMRADKALPVHMQDIIPDVDDMYRGYATAVSEVWLFVVLSRNLNKLSEC